MNSKKRITAANALKHSWFTVAPEKTTPLNADIIGNLSNFAKVLNISFSAHFAMLLSYLTFFRFDFSLVVSIGCIMSDSYFTSLGVSFGVVVLIGAVVYANYLYLQKTASDEGQLRELFLRFDKDSNGITEDEIVALIETHPKLKKKVAFSADQIKTIFTAADTDGSGRLEFEMGAGLELEWARFDFAGCSLGTHRGRM